MTAGQEGKTREHTNFNNRLQPTEIGLGTSSTSTSVVGLTYSYGTTNNNGNVQSVGYSGGGLSYTQNFGYDALNRLATSNENSGSSWSETNGYDRYGNRWIDLGGGNQSLYFNSANNRITNSGYVYDASGNLTNDTLHTYGFDAENKIKTVDSVNDVYRYDGDGNRVRKNFATGEKVRMVYSGGQLVAEYDLSNGSLKKEYVYGAKGLIATIEPSNGTRYTTSDHLGSPRVVTNSSAGVVSRHDYIPFGVELGAGVGGRTTGMGFSVTDGVRQKFTSKERDNETGLDWFGPGRYYASGQGRFTSADPLAASAKPVDPQTWNRYAYVLNKPTIAIDPDGLSIIVVIVSPRGAGGSGNASIRLNARTGREVRDVGGIARGRGPDRTQRYNDTPFGVYSPTANDPHGANANGTQGGISGQAARSDNSRFGTGIIYMTPVSGEVVDNGRSTIYIHGGPTLEDRQALGRTDGCVRTENANINTLISDVNDLARNGDPLTNIFVGDAATINTIADERDQNGNFRYPELRNSGFGTNNATPHTGDEDEHLETDELREHEMEGR